MADFTRVKYIMIIPPAPLDRGGTESILDSEELGGSKPEPIGISFT
jgi:hypothetical protein